MPVIPAASSPDAAQLQYIHLEDFTPGIYDASYVSSEQPLLPAPLGAATAEGTWCCAGFPGGGLGPLPKLVRKWTFGFGFKTSTHDFVTMMTVNPMLNTGLAEVVFAIESQTGTHDHNFRCYSFLPTPTTTHLVDDVTSPATPGYFGSPFPVWTRMGIRVTALTPPTPTHTPRPTPTPPPPRLVFPASVASDANGIDGHIYIYPGLLAPKTFSLEDMVIPGTNITGQIVGYDGRIVATTSRPFTWPAGDQVVVGNELVCFTDPPETQFYGNQGTVFVPENPFGYGAMGSISAGELFLVKKWGGGVFLTGDIDTPTSVITLTGVEPTGDFYGRGDGGDDGFYYCAEGRGAWVWNGGNTSQKISTQIADSFFDVETNVIQSNNFGFFVQKWGDLVVYSGNYIYNRRTKSWFKLYPRDTEGNATAPGRSFFHYDNARSYKSLYASPLKVTDVANGTIRKQWLFRFDNTTGASHYQWKSQPIHVSATGRRRVDARELVLRISQPTGTGGTVKVTINTFTYTTSGALSSDPSIHRANIGNGARGVEDFYITINSDNPGGPAPIVHSIDLSFQPRAAEAVSN